MEQLVLFHIYGASLICENCNMYCRHVRIPQEARQLLWNHAIQRSCYVFVEGYVGHETDRCSDLYGAPSCVFAFGRGGCGSALLKPRSVATREGLSCSWTSSSSGPNWKRCPQLGLGLTWGLSSVFCFRLQCLAFPGHCLITASWRTTSRRTTSLILISNSGWQNTRSRNVFVVFVFFKTCFISSVVIIVAMLLSP